MCVQWYHRRLDKPVHKGAARRCVWEQKSNFCVSLRSWSALGISYSLGKLDGICGTVWSYMSRDFYFKCTVKIGGVSIEDYTVAEMWLHTCPVQRWSEMLNSVGSQVCVFSNLVDLPVVCLSSLHWCRARTHLYISLRRICVLIFSTTAIFFSLEWARLCHVKAACFHFMRCHRTVTRRFGINKFTRRLGVKRENKNDTTKSNHWHCHFSKGGRQWSWETWSPARRQHRLILRMWQKRVLAKSYPWNAESWEQTQWSQHRERYSLWIWCKIIGW